MADDISLVIAEPDGKTPDTTPRVGWTFVDSSHSQAAYRVIIVDFEDTTLYDSGEVASSDWYWDIPAPGLTPVPEDELYEAQVQVKCTGGTWSSVATLEFQIVFVGEDVFRYYKNMDGAGNGFEDWLGASVDITADPERVKLAAGSGGYQEGTFIIQHDGNFPDIGWGYMVYDATLPEGTSIEVRAKASNTESALASADWTTAVVSESGQKLGGVGLLGRYIELRITLKPNDAQTETPVLSNLVITFLIPASAGPQTRRWSGFTADSGTYIQTEPNDEGEIVLQAQAYTTAYADSGYLVLRHDTRAIVDWEALDWVGNVETGTTLKFEFRAFDTIAEAASLAWGGLAELTTGTSGTVPISLAGKRYIDVKITLVPNSAKDATPYVTSVTLSWVRLATPTTKYLYTGTIDLPSNLAKILLTANHDAPAGCEVTYGVTCENSTAFEDDYQAVPPNTLTTITAPGRRFRLGVRLRSGSLVALPVFHELAYQIETENRDMLYLSS